MSKHIVNINNTDNKVTVTNANQKIIITDNDACTSVNVTSPVTSIVQVSTLGPQGIQGIAGTGGGTGNIDTGSFAITGSNIFYGNQIISASDVSGLDIHVGSDYSWTFRTYNNTYSSTSIGLASWIADDGISFFGTETNRPLYIYNDANYYSPTIIISSSGVTIDSILIVNNGITGSLYGTSSWTENYNELDPIFTAVSGTFATTGSNIFTGSQTISGSITFDGGVQITPTYYGSNGNGIDIVAGFNGFVELVSNDAQNYFWIDNFGAYILTSNSHTWIFGNDGVLDAPGSIEATSFTGSLYGTSSWAEHSLTASYVPGITSIDTSLFITTSSFNTFTSSYSTGSFTGSFIGSFLGTASYATYAVNSNQALYAQTANGALTASYVELAQQALSTNYASTAGTANQTSTVLVYQLANPASPATAYFPIVDNTAGQDPTQGLYKTVYEASLFTYEKDANEYTFAGSAARITPTVNVGDEQTRGQFNVIGNTETKGNAVISGSVSVSGSIIATGNISAPNISTGLATLNFVSDFLRPTESVVASFSVTDNKLVLTGVPYSGSFVGNLTGTASYAITASYYNETDPIFTAKLGSLATTGSNSFNGNQAITGSLIITQNLIVLGSSSITYLTASQLTVSMSYISVNVFEPQQRFGGLYVFDSGSSAATASLTWDSLYNRWVYTNQNGSGYSGGGLMSGPRNTGSLGEEIYPTQNTILKGQGGDHLTDSNITDNGTIVSINSNTQITGSLTTTDGLSVQSVTASFINVSGNITGNLIGSSSWAYNTITASYAPNYVLNSVTSSLLGPYVLSSTTSSMLAPYVLSSATGSVLSSYVLNSVTSSMLSPYVLTSTTSSMLSPYVLNSKTGSFAITGSNVFNGNQIITGSVLGNVSALSISSNTASLNLSINNFFTLQLVQGTTTHISPSNISPGQTVNILISTTGSATVSFPSTVKQPSGFSYTPTTTTAKDILTFISFDSSALYMTNVKNLI